MLTSSEKISRFQGLNLKGSITSPEFTIRAVKYSFLIGGHGDNVGVQLLIYDQVRTLTQTFTT